MLEASNNELRRRVAELEGLASARKVDIPDMMTPTAVQMQEKLLNTEANVSAILSRYLATNPPPLVISN